MYTRYFYWQFIAAPLWLLKLAINMQIVLVTMFSVPVMLKTLFAYWHKDSVSLQQGSISGMMTALAWNAISRAIGFVIRSIILVVWLIVAIVTLIVSVIAVVLFIVWPLLALFSVVFGISALVNTAAL